MLNNEEKQLFLYIEQQDANKVREAINAGVDVNVVDITPLSGNGNTPLHEAAAVGNSTIINILIEAGAEINKQCNAGWTPLMRACNSGNPKAAITLLELGADPTIKNNEGYSAYDRVLRSEIELCAKLKLGLGTA